MPYLDSPADPLQAGVNILQPVDGAALAVDWLPEQECMCVREGSNREREKEREGRKGERECIQGEGTAIKRSVGQNYEMRENVYLCVCVCVCVSIGRWRCHGEGYA